VNGRWVLALAPAITRSAGGQPPHLIQRRLETAAKKSGQRGVATYNPSGNLDPFLVVIEQIPRLADTAGSEQPVGQFTVRLVQVKVLAAGSALRDNRFDAPGFRRRRTNLILTLRRVSHLHLLAQVSMPESGHGATRVNILTKTQSKLTGFVPHF
jgi:hypothetical protein